MFVIRERLYAHPVDYGCEYEDLPYYTTIPWLSWRRVFKAFCGLLIPCIIPFSGINHKVRDIKV